MGPVNLKNPNYSSSARLTVKNTILDRTFTRLSEIPVTRFGTQVLDFRTILDSEFSFLRRDNSYFQFHRMPILMRYPITARLAAVRSETEYCRLAIVTGRFHLNSSYNFHFFIHSMR